MYFSIYVGFPRRLWWTSPFHFHVDFSFHFHVDIPFLFKLDIRFHFYIYPISFLWTFPLMFTWTSLLISMWTSPLIFMQISLLIFLWTSPFDFHVDIPFGFQVVWSSFCPCLLCLSLDSSRRFILLRRCVTEKAKSYSFCLFFFSFFLTRTVLVFPQFYMYRIL